MLNPDFRDMLSALNDAGAEYLIVGAYAMSAHGVPRSTGDIDVWVNATLENAPRVWQALIQFGAPTSDWKVEDFKERDLVFQIGIAPFRIDLLTSIDGIEFAAAEKNRITVKIDGITIPVIGLDDLILNKRACGRPKDLVDVQLLLKRPN